MLKKIMMVIVIALIGGGLLGYQQIQTLSPEILDNAIKQFGSIQMLVVITIAQTILLTVIATVIGLKLETKTNLNKQVGLNKSSILITIMISLVAALSISIPEKSFFVKALSLPETYTFSSLYFLSSLIYGGIIEELMLRFGVMTLIVWILQKITKSADHKSSYVIGILIASFLFSIGHLPSTFQMFGMNQIAIFRGLILNFIPGVCFGYIYWKHGIGYAIIAHMLTHVINQCLLFPILF